MAKDINLTSKEWNDIVFEGKPKDYGAYQLRKTSSKRHIIAFIIVIIFVVIVSLLPKLIETVQSFRPEAGNIDTENILVDLDPLDEELEKQDQIAQQAAELEPPPPLVKSAVAFTAPEIVDDDQIKPEEQLKSQQELTDSKAQISFVTVEGTDDEFGLDPEELLQHQMAAEAEVDVRVYDQVEQMPEYPGGNAELRRYLVNNLRYPREAEDNGLFGTVIVMFTVGRDGSITNVQIKQGVDRSLNDEAMRLVRNMPKWIPGKYNGRAVNVKYELPVTFVLQ